MTYILSPQAKSSLQNIRSYTLEQHGARQTKIYLQMLRDQMRKAAKNPIRDGKARDDIKPGYYAIRAGKPHIYYRIRDTHIDIIDVLHQRMEPTNYI